MTEVAKVHWQAWGPPDAQGVQLWFCPCGYPNAARNKNLWFPLRITRWRKRVTCRRCRAWLQK